MFFLPNFIENLLYVVKTGTAGSSSFGVVGYLFDGMQSVFDCDLFDFRIGYAKAFADYPALFGFILL